MPKAQSPHEVAATVPPDRLVVALVRNLAEATGGRVTYRVPVEPTGVLAPIATWPRQAAGPLTGETAREPVAGGGVIQVASPRRWSGREQAMLRETAGWLGMAARLDQLEADRHHAAVRARDLRAEVIAARERSAHVRTLERRRLVRSITTTTLRDLDDVRQGLRRLEGAVTEDPASLASEFAMSELATVRSAMDELLDEFRVVVRGVYPAMLPDRGPGAALEELAATLPRPVRFTGGLGRRVDWQIESGFYHAVAAVLTVLCGSAAAAVPRSAVDVAFSRDDALRARVSAPVGGLSAAELRGALGHDAERLAVLGGSMTSAVIDGVAVVDAAVAERINPSVRDPVPSRSARSDLHDQVLALVRKGQQAVGEGPARRGWDVIAERLTTPARLAVVRDPAHAGPARPVRSGVVLVDVVGPADEALARELLADGGPRGSIDGVLCLVQPTAAFRAALRSAPQRVVLSETASEEELARVLAVRGPVIAARRALVSARELASVLPADDPLLWEIDRITAAGHEIAELDLLDDLEHGDNRLLRGAGWGAVADAARLLGAHGADPRSRLGLPTDTTDDALQEAARRAVCRWRAYAGRPGTGGRDRLACEVLARTAEGMISEARIR
ncbi:hypothetical protein [Actinophytocola xanthii]|uniref:Uncharacterized protein n=1 Tax=Actinophytocola xanthii TaxID=1912961 RepID=A0A1Q8CTH5_9PSEU|nr:hypothetical protein [Actinophytocola xanthii]OLF17647.1 hypothetical protein BU204_10545 [Actinophytocola xanthii]